MYQNESTIVIGAGMAGIAAARELHDARRRVKVLEARNRIGGRTHTDDTLGPTIDLGGSWIHGPIGNPLTPLAKKFGVEWGMTDFTNQYSDNVMAFNADGTHIDMDAYSEGLQRFSGAMAHAYGSTLYDWPDETVLSLADLYAHGLPGIDDLTLDQQKGFYYASVVRVQYSAASDLDKIDWRLGNEFVTLPGNDLLLYGGGYNRITDGLAQGLDIETGVVVEEIRYNDDGVEVITNRDTLHCDRVLVTVPLGVLRAGSIKFSPELPSEKQRAIIRMGMGNYEKLALRFPYCFWPKEPQRFNYLTDQVPELFTSWLNNAHYTGEPILIAYHAGSRAEHVNTMNDSALIEEAMATLRILFGKDIPIPDMYVRTGWGKDRYSLGSYSFNKVGGRSEDRQILAQPVANRLFFAGEATHTHYYATVHGAYESGIRAAREIQRISLGRTQR